VYTLQAIVAATIAPTVAATIVPPCNYICNVVNCGTQGRCMGV